MATEELTTTIQHADVVAACISHNDALMDAMLSLPALPDCDARDDTLATLNHVIDTYGELLDVFGIKGQLDLFAALSKEA
jgi:hypothetical protein